MDLQNFISAVQKINARSLLGAVTATQYDVFSRDHAVNAQQYLQYTTDNPPTGLARYRQLLLSFEQALQAQNQSVTLPYWNFPIDFASPEKSAVLSQKYMGGNGTGAGSTVSDGPFSGWQVAYPGLDELVPVVHVLRRAFDQGATISPWASPEFFALTVQTSPDLATFTQRVMGATSNVFTGIGGQFGDMGTTNSPNDPLFWIVMAYVDNLYGRWLSNHPEAPQPAPVCYNYA
ncbi:tyrosinase family protein [Burkholderia sp. Nafp2/4-1b]|uniref:tyrosinase family protein n=1 Tax=Burkholderia sp. Nafp2/4-1b TaxID=2116686 RepID=UPI0013CE4DE0|nr:tyrosinase family protein [Burkholderia sp. Nafp2/4-1b]